MVKKTKKEFKIANIIFSVVFFCLAAAALVYCVKSVVTLNDLGNQESFDFYSSIIETHTLEIEILISAFATATFAGFGFLGLKRN